MLSDLKKMSAMAYLFPVSAVAAVVALAVAVFSCSGEGFAMEEMPLIVVLSVAAVILNLAVIIVGAKTNDGILTAMCIWAVILCLAACICAMVIGKSDVFGTVIFSDLEKGYLPAEQACYYGVASIIVYIVAALSAAVGSFCPVKKAEK